LAHDSRVLEVLEEILESGCSPEQACEGCPDLLPEVRRRLRGFRSVEAQLETVFPSSFNSDRDRRAKSRAFDGTLPSIPGYEVQTILGRGGMGVVYRARQLQLNRIVALKMLLLGEYANATERKRFLREAMAVARLSHPNIVQVYDLGECSGRPYFTMEFVEGGTLADKLRGTPYPANAAAALVRTLAEAVQVAHEAAIIHRDLKPSNILLMPGGAPKISDFGLAREVDSVASITLGGAYLGTPSYMAPEQAGGKTGDISPKSDVYSLGAILYELLTGRPPFQGETPVDTIRQVLNQEPVPPARLNGRVPRDLQTICLQCLNKDPKRRYGSAAALADDISRFQRSEPIAARPTGIIERTGKWIWRNPALASMLLAAVVLCAVGVGVAFRFMTERAATIRAAEMDLQEVSEAEQRSDWTAAAAALDRARVRMQNGTIPSLKEQLEDDQRDLAFGQRLESIGLNRMSLVDPIFGGLFDNDAADAAYSNEFRQSGLGSIGDDPAAVARRINQSNVRSALIAALDDWAICAGDEDHRRWLFEVARRSDPDPTGWRDRARDPSVGSAAMLTKLAESDGASNQPVRLLTALGERLENVGAGSEAIAFLRRVQAQYPDHFWANFILADALRKSGNCAESVRYFQAAIALRPQSTVAIGNLGMALAADNRTEEAADQFREEVRIDPQSSHAHYSLGLALRKLGRAQEAAAELGESVRLKSDGADHQYNLALALVDEGQLDEATDHFRAAIKLDPTLADAYYNLGLVMQKEGASAEAIGEFRQAIKLKPNNAPAEYCLGLALKSEGKLGEAIEHLSRATQIDPRDANAHYNLGLALMVAGQNDKAIDQFQTAIRIDPTEAEVHYNLGLALMVTGQNDKAIDQFQAAIALDPSQADVRYNLGLALMATGQRAKAVDQFQAAIELDPSQANVHYNLGLALMATGQKDKAIDQFQAAIAIDPKQADLHYNLGVVLMTEGKNDQAVEQFQDVLNIEPNNSRAQYLLGLILKGQGKLDAAIQHLSKATELDPSDADAHYNLGLGLIAAGRKDMAVGEFQLAIKIDPTLADAHFNLGIALMTSGHLDEAIEHFQRTIAINPSNAYAFGGLGNALAGKGRLAEAKVALQQCLNLLPANDPWRQQYVDALRQCEAHLPKQDK
jgi:eukaryotic-like serine/threonine-protein kinase